MSLEVMGPCHKNTSYKKSKNVLENFLLTGLLIGKYVNELWVFWVLLPHLHNVVILR